MPDTEWKEGPDNLWELSKGKYWVVECKNEVLEGRAEINKGESGQMNNALSWFKRNYPAAESINTMIIPTREIGSAAGFNEQVSIIRVKKLRTLKNNVRAFFNEFKTEKFQNLDPGVVSQKLVEFQLDLTSLPSKYCETSIQNR